VIAAQKQAKHGETVLLSPACTSFDQFRDFNERGDCFAAAVRGLTEKV
jgi:UDP-N-acetylmuramoylalanine--D-glutamate ligase